MNELTAALAALTEAGIDFEVLEESQTRLGESPDHMPLSA